MKQLIATLMLLFALAESQNACAQDFSNKGKEFWIPYSYHVGMSGGGDPVMTLYLTSDVTTTYTVEISGGASISTGSITAGTVMSVDIPIAYAINDEGLFNNKAVHVTAAKPIVVYAYITRSAASAATLCLPVSVLGKEYIASSFSQYSNEPNSYSFVTIVAVEDGTTVEITPSVTTKNLWNAGSTYQVSLNKGQIYQILGFLNNVASGGVYRGGDVSGTIVRSVSTGTGSCKRIAVFSGTGKIRIPGSGSCGGSSDNLYQQLYPTSTWGKKFLTVPSKNNPFNYYRVYRKDATTNVSVNGVAVPSASFANSFYQLPLNNTPNLIEADGPISVAQYFTTQGCEGNPSGQPYDPDMIMLNPVEQNISNVTMVSSNLAAAETSQFHHQHHIHVIMRNGGTGISSFRFDGQPVAASLWTVHPKDPNYSYVYLADVTGAGLTVGQGNHTLKSDSGFLALAYGYANAESYGYSAGANVKELYQFASIKNQYATVNYPATCQNTPFSFSMTFPYQPTQIKWQFNGLFPDVTTDNPVPESTYVLAGKTVYRYGLPGTYSATAVGTFPIRILATGANADGCGGEQEINYDLQVFDRPKAAFSFTGTGCVSDPVQFTDGSNGQGRPFQSYSWNFGDNTNSTLQSPSHTYTAANSYSVSLYGITDIGCISDTAVHPVAVTQPPVASFTVSTPNCVNKTITFNSTSTVPSGTISSWTWNFGDGTPTVNATTGAAQTHSYANTGSFAVTLQVATAGGCRSTVFTQNITVSANPVAGFTFGNACLPAGAMSFSNTSTVAGGAALSYLWDFGVTGASSTQTSPTYNYTATGPFIVRLAATAATGCSDTSTQTVNTVFARPTSTFTASATPVAGKYCRNSPVTFTSSATAPASTISEWHWDFGDGSQSIQQNPVKTYANAGTYTVKHWVVSAVGCVSDTTPLTLTIVPLPLASFTVGTHLCIGDAVSLTSNSSAVAAGGTITSLSWTLNTVPMSGPQAAQMSFVPTTTGNNDVVLTVQTEVGCTDDSAFTIVANPKPTPDFTLPNVCLPAGTATFSNLTTISNGTLSTVTYQWDFGDGGTGSTQNAPTHTYPAIGPYTVQLTATSAAGCVETASKQLTTIYAQPQAAFTPGSNEVCIGAPFTFTDGSSAPGSTVTGWAWDFGDGTTETTQSPTHTYAAPGNYTVTLTVTSAVGCVSAATPHPVTVNRLPTAAFAISAPMCAGQAVTLTDASTANSGSLQTWSWNLGDGSAVQTGAGPISYTYNTVGNYGVTLNVTTDKGCSANFTDTVRVHPIPLAGFVIPQNCLADPYSEFTDTSHIAAPDAISTWSWNFADGSASPPSSNFSTQQNPRHRYTVAGTYPVTLTVTSNHGCQGSITQPVIVSNTSPVPVLTLIKSSVCSNDSVHVKDSSWVDIGQIIRIDIWWDASDPASVQTILNPVANTVYSHLYPETFSAVPPVNIKLVAYSGQTCGIDITKPVTLLPTPDVQFAPMTGVCADRPAFPITQATSANQAVVPGVGTFSGTGVTSAGMFSPSAAGVGLYPIKYTFTGNNGCKNDTTMPIAVFGVPTADAGPDQYVLEGGQAILLGTGTGNSLQYVWTPARWLSGDSVAQPVVMPMGDENYTLTVTSADGCTASDRVFVKQLKTPLIPNVFTPNGDGVNDRWTIQYLQSYPGATVEVYNRYGQLVYRVTNYDVSWDGTMNGKDLPVGTYYYIVNPKNGRKQMTGFVDLIR